jgi:hypothetical protein
MFTSNVSIYVVETAEHIYLSSYYLLLLLHSLLPLVKISSNFAPLSCVFNIQFSSLNPKYYQISVKANGKYTRCFVSVSISETSLDFYQTAGHMSLCVRYVKSRYLHKAQNKYWYNSRNSVTLVVPKLWGAAQGGLFSSGGGGGRQLI